MDSLKRIKLNFGKLLTSTKFKIIIIALMLSLSIFYSFLLRFTRFFVYSTQEKFQVIILILIMGFPIAFIFFYSIVPLLQKSQKLLKKPLRAYVVVLLLTLTSFILFYKLPPFPIKYSLKIQPIVDVSENPDRQKITILSIVFVDEPTGIENRLTIENFKLPQGWSYLSSGTSFVFENQMNDIEPEKITIIRNVQGKVFLTFETSPESGTVKVSNNGEERVFDLKSSTLGTREIDLTIPRTFTRANTSRKIILVGCVIAEFFLTCSLCIFLLFIFLNKNKRKIVRIHGLGIVAAILLVSTLSLGLINSYDEQAFFPDDNLEAAIREVIDNPDRPISVQQLRTISVLDISAYRIKSLDGIENLTNLQELQAGVNQISDLAPIGSLKNLQILNLESNYISDLKEANFDLLLNLPIKELNLSNNSSKNDKSFLIRLEDISLIGELNSLQELYLKGNAIENISVVSHLTNLRTLDLENNKINELPDLCKLNKLTTLILERNQLSDISQISCLKNLLELNLHSNIRINSIRPIHDLVNLKKLVLENINVGDQLDVLINLEKLHFLNLSNCGIDDLSTLGYLMEKGVLQDNLDLQIEATLKLRDNPAILKNEGSLKILEKYWMNIKYRDPIILPQTLFSNDFPIFSTPGGFYKEGFQLELSADDPDLQILYTLDGSEPTILGLNSTNPFQRTYVYENSLQIKSRIGDHNQFSLFRTSNNQALDEILGFTPSDWYPPDEEVFKATVVRARTFDPSNSVLGKTMTNTYFVDEDILSRYATLPIISLNSDYKYLFEPDIGIYTPAFPEKSVPANIEYYEPGKKIGFNGTYEVSIQGNTSRLFPQKSLNVKANEWVGEPSINYSLYNNSVSNANQLDKFSSFVIRSWGTARERSVIFSDAYNQKLLAKTDMEFQDYQPVIVFINGEYWGLHEIRQAIKNPYYFSAITGLDPIDPGFDILTTLNNVDEGDSNDWDELMKFMQTKDMKKNINYDYVCTKMDTDNFISYVIHNVFTGKQDWPENNDGKWKPKINDAKWRWYLYDMDFGYFTPQLMPDYDVISRLINMGSYPEFTTLLENQEFKNRFLNIYADHLNSYYLTSVQKTLFDQMLNEIEPYMPEYQARWQLNKNWEQEKQYAVDVIEHRTDLRRQQIIETFKLSGTYVLKLNSNPSMGQIQINSILIDETLPGVIDPSSWSGQYFYNVPVTITAIPLEGYTFDHWETELDIDRESNTVIIDPLRDISLTAVFKQH